MNYNLTLKGHLENLTSGQGHDLTRKGHVAYQLIRIVDLNTSEVFSSLPIICAYQKLLAKSLCNHLEGRRYW